MRKKIKNFENYCIYDNGDVINLSTNKILKGSIGENGYKYYRLSKNNHKKMFYAHRLVAEHFIDNPYNLPQVNHKDECKINNCVTNLEWCTQQQNHDYGTRNERTGRSQMNKQGSKVLLQYDLQGNFIKEFPSVSEASRELGKSQANISRCANGFKNQAYGFIWKFKE